MSKKFLVIANCWLLITVLLGILAMSGCLFVPDGGDHGHDDDHHDDHGPAQQGYDDHHDQDPH